MLVQRCLRCCRRCLTETPRRPCNGAQAADTVQKANSGHPGAPMGMAVAAHVLWTKFLRFNPDQPHWVRAACGPPRWRSRDLVAQPNRDRFVLSNGHACALLYSMLHLRCCARRSPHRRAHARRAQRLQGHHGRPQEVPPARQHVRASVPAAHALTHWAPRSTPGHPEAGVTPGVEVSTGPLGQGITNSVGLAIGESHLVRRGGVARSSRPTCVRARATGRGLQPSRL